MANDVITNPLVIDTASATALITRSVYITMISWVPAAGSVLADTAVVTDKNGRAFWKNSYAAIGTPADIPLAPADTQFIPPQAIAGIIVPTLATGTLYIYFQESKNG